MISFTGSACEDLLDGVHRVVLHRHRADDVPSRGVLEGGEGTSQHLLGLGGLVVPLRVEQVQLGPGRVGHDHPEPCRRPVGPSAQRVEELGGGLRDVGDDEHPVDVCVHVVPPGDQWAGSGRAVADAVLDWSRCCSSVTSTRVMLR